MPAVTGTLEDIGAGAMSGLNARIILCPEEVSTKGSVIMPTKEIVATVGSGGAFSFPNVRASLQNNPFTPYKMSIEWSDAAGNLTRSDFPDWRIVVPAEGGLLADMVSIVTASKIVTKGDNANSEDIEAAVSALLPGILATAPEIIAAGEQAAADALAAADVLVGGEDRSPENGEPETFQVAFLDGRMPLQADKDGVHLGETLIQPGEDFQVVDLDGRILMEWLPTGQTAIYDPVFPNGITGVSGSSTKVTVLHTFLAVGQSNMSGRGLPSGGTYDPADPRIFEYGANNRTFRPASVPLDMHDPASGLSPATSFAREYLKTQPPNVGVLIIPAAHGGTGFTGAASTLTWSVNAASSSQYDLPTLAVTQTLQGIAAAKAAGYTVTLQGALWHQGENNSSFSTAGYSAKLDELIAFFRTQLAAPKLPFVVGQMTPETIASTPGRDGIDMSHHETPARVAYTGFALATANGVNVGETVHFSRVGIEFLGKTYLSGYWQAVFNVLAAAPSAPVGVSAKKSGTTVTASWDAPPATLTQSPTYDLYGGGASYVWSAPTSHITGYRVEVKTGAGAWSTVTRDWGMYLSETITGVPAGTTQVRVTALNGAAASAPITATATGA